MAEEQVVNDRAAGAAIAEPAGIAEPLLQAPVPPIQSRFLFVDVAAQRAKQLRRGALPRVQLDGGSHKAERLAMEEVRRGLIPYELPGDRPRTGA